MTPETPILIKVIAGTLLVIALTISFLERWFAPTHIVTEDSRSFPSWVGWFGWGLAALATILYVAVDLIEWRS